MMLLGLSVSDELLMLMLTDWQLGREVLDEAAKAVAVGVSTDEIDRIVHEASVTCWASDS